MNFSYFSFIVAETLLQSKENEMEGLNDIIYNDICKLAKTSLYSKVKINFYDKCPKVVEGCSVTSCEVPTVKFGDEEGFIDLLKTVESYSPGIKHSNMVWADIYKTTTDKTLLKVLSGLHFSVTTHIAAFHTKMFGRFISNPRKLQMRYRDEYKSNFLMLYSIIRAAVGNIKNVPSAANEETLALSKKIYVDSMPNVGMAATEVVDKCIECIACLNCEKCVLWGTIQTRGLKAAIKALNNRELYKNDLIYLINLFRRLSETVKQSKRMSTVRFAMIYLPLVYYKHFLALVILVLVVAAIKIKRSARKYKWE